MKAMGFGDRFIRMWCFYLTYYIATFKYRKTDVIQWELQHAG